MNPLDTNRRLACRRGRCAELHLGLPGWPSSWSFWDSNRLVRALALAVQLVRLGSLSKKPANNRPHLSLPCGGLGFGEIAPVADAARSRCWPRPFLLTAIVPVLLMLIVGAWWRHRYPFGWSHSCDKGLMFALDQYATDHNGSFPAGESTPEASLSLLYPDYGNEYLLHGKTVHVETVRRVLEGGGRLGPDTCGWHYVEGLRQGDNRDLALCWDKVGLGHKWRAANRWWAQRHLRGHLHRLCPRRQVARVPSRASEAEGDPRCNQGHPRAMRDSRQWRGPASFQSGGQSPSSPSASISRT